MNVTKGQLEYEFNHLQNKLWMRDHKKYLENEFNVKNHNDEIKYLESHPLFRVREGQIESWEKIK